MNTLEDHPRVIRSILKRPMLLAIRESQKSQYKQKLGAVIVKGSRVLSRGHNSVRGHRYSKYYSFPESCHAETAALMECKSEGFNGSVYVARVNRAGELRNARPCASCLSLLKDHGIRRVYYTTNAGVVECRL